MASMGKRRKKISSQINCVHSTPEDEMFIVIFGFLVKVSCFGRPAVFFIVLKVVISKPVDGFLQLIVFSHVSSLFFSNDCR